MTVARIAATTPPCGPYAVARRSEASDVALGHTRAVAARGTPCVALARVEPTRGGLMPIGINSCGPLARARVEPTRQALTGNVPSEFTPRARGADCTSAHLQRCK